MILTHATDQRTKDATPWGQADNKRIIAPGIIDYSTPGHGGIKLTAALAAKVSRAFPTFETFAGGPWYEEDCDWAFVAVVFPQYWPPKVLEAARNTIRSCYDGKHAEELNALELT